MSSEKISLGRGILAIISIAIIAAALLAYTSKLTAPRIAQNEVMLLQRGLREVLPRGQYDNQPHADVYLATSSELLGSDEALPIYRARSNGNPSAAVITAIAPDGYVGLIRLLVSVNMNGTVHAVRAVEHNETPGLGDAIDREKSDWITQFEGVELGGDAGADWRIQRDAGEIDQITGATVTSRAVANAVRDALHYFSLHKDEIFASGEAVASP